MTVMVAEGERLAKKLLAPLEIEVAECLARGRFSSTCSTYSMSGSGSGSVEDDAGYGFAASTDDGETARTSREDSGMTESSSTLSPRRQGSKKGKLTAEERKQRSRERNRMHARRTRERKKLQMLSLQDHIRELREERFYLKQLVKEQEIASTLLCMAGNGAVDHTISNCISTFGSVAPCTKASFLRLLESVTSYFSQNLDQDGTTAATTVPAEKPSCPLERQRIRRERNRMHAKRTRDRKKIFMEASEIIIEKMKTENLIVHDQLQALGLLPADYQAKIASRYPATSMALIEDIEALWDFSQAAEASEDLDGGALTIDTTSTASTTTSGTKASSASLVQSPPSAETVKSHSGSSGGPIKKRAALGPTKMALASFSPPPSAAAYAIKPVASYDTLHRGGTCVKKSAAAAAAAATSVEGSDVGTKRKWGSTKPSMIHPMYVYDQKSAEMKARVVATEDSTTDASDGDGCTSSEGDSEIGEQWANHATGSFRKSHMSLVVRAFPRQPIKK